MNTLTRAAEYKMNNHRYIIILLVSRLYIAYEMYEKENSNHNLRDLQFPPTNQPPFVP